MNISIIVPAYNEQHEIAATVRTLLHWLDQKGFAHGEVIVVDDGSDDGTTERLGVISDPRLVVLGYPTNRGKGYAVSKGVERAQGAHILFTDADLSMPIEMYDKLATALEAGGEDADIAVASRAKPGATVGRRPPRHRALMGRVFNTIVRTTLVPGIQDSQCGFKLFRRDAAKQVFAQRSIDGFAFDVELLVIAGKLGLRVAEVPVHWDHRGRSRIVPFRDTVRMLAELVRIYRRHK